MLKALCSWVLSISKDRGFTTSLGKPKPPVKLFSVSNQDFPSAVCVSCLLSFCFSPLRVLYLLYNSPADCWKQQLKLSLSPLFLNLNKSSSQFVSVHRASDPYSSWGPSSGLASVLNQFSHTREPKPDWITHLLSATITVPLLIITILHLELYQRRKLLIVPLFNFSQYSHICHCCWHSQAANLNALCLFAHIPHQLINKENLTTLLWNN